MAAEFFNDYSDYPFGRLWEAWTEEWCKWMFSCGRGQNPCLDRTGELCSVHQQDKNVWFLAGTLGNIAPVRRKCTILSRYALFLPIILKEDSFVEDSDLCSEEDLSERAKMTIDRVMCVDVNIDGKRIEPSKVKRVQSNVFDLIFPENNVYNVPAGMTRSVCDGYWLFVKSLRSGNHVLHFKGLIVEPRLCFKVEVFYDLDIRNGEA